MSGIIAPHSRQAAELQRANLEAALLAARYGNRVFPVRSKDETLKDGKLRKAKSPKVTGWQEKATVNESRIRRWSRQFPDCLFAMLTGPVAGFSVIDLDRHGEKDGFKAVAEMRVVLSSQICVRTAGGGEHHFYDAADVPSTSGVIAPGVDTKGEGGYVLIPGTTLPDGRTYSFAKGDWQTLEDDRDLVGLFPIPEPLRDALRPGRPIGEAVQAAEDQSGIPTAVDYARAKLGIAKARVTEATGGHRTRALFDAALWMGGFVACQTLHEDEVTAALLQAADMVGMSVDYDPDDLLRQIGNGLRTGAKFPIIWKDPASAFNDIESADEHHEIALPAASGLTFLTPAECASRPARSYLVKGLIGQRDVVAIVGPPGAGKSLLAPRLAYAVAQGAEVFGRRTKAGGVFYVAAEDGQGMGARLQALRQDHGEADDLSLVLGVSDLLSKGGHLEALRAEVKARRPSLVIIDTLAAAFPGLKENDPDGMGQVVAAARSLTSWGAAVVLIHHDTKAGDGLPRGHSILNGALDISLALSRDGDMVTAKPSKNRNGTTEITLAFTIRSRVLGEDEDGEPITAAIAVEADANGVAWRVPKLPPAAAAAFRMLGELSAEGRPVPEEIWRDACVNGRDVSQSEKWESRRDSFKRAVRELMTRRLIFFGEGHYRFATASPDTGAIWCEEFPDGEGEE